jgi:hypothetical protein
MEERMEALERENKVLREALEVHHVSIGEMEGQVHAPA